MKYWNYLRMKNKRSRGDWILSSIVIALFFVFTIVGITISLHRYWQYEVFYIDFGQYDQSIWEISRFKMPMLDHWILGFVPIFADHFTPSVFLLSPLYWFTLKSEIILIAQAVLVGLSGLVLYSIGNAVLRNKFISLSVLTSYYLFVGLQNAVITEFHEITIMTFFLMSTFWAFVKNRKILYYVLLFVTLGFKETTFLVGICLGISIFLIDKKWKREAILTVIISIIWGILALKVIIPYFSSMKYLYSGNISNISFGWIFSLFDSPLKVHTLIYSFLSFGFLPLFSPQFWPLILQDYITRFIPQNFITRWDLGLHYNALSSVFLAISSIYSFKFIFKYSIVKKYKYIIAVLIIFNALILNRFILHGPFNLFFNKTFYEHTAQFEFLNKIVKMVPARATVATHNNLASRFTHQRVWLLRDTYEMHKPEYIVIDNRSGQSPNNFVITGSLDEILIKILRDTKYGVIYSSKEQYVFKRK